MYLEKGKVKVVIGVVILALSFAWVGYVLGSFGLAEEGQMPLMYTLLGLLCGGFLCLLGVWDIEEEKIKSKVFNVRERKEIEKSFRAFGEYLDTFDRYAWLYSHSSSQESIIEDGTVVKRVSIYSVWLEFYIDGEMIGVCQGGRARTGKMQFEGLEENKFYKVDEIW